jgi:hypothetical protein
LAAGAPLLVGAASVPFVPCGEVTVAVAASECCKGALGLQAARETLMTTRAIAAEYLGMFVFCEMKSAGF